MSLGLKIFWISILAILVIGFVYLATFGVPSPSVDVRQKIDLTSKFK